MNTDINTKKTQADDNYSIQLNFKLSISDISGCDNIDNIDNIENKVTLISKKRKNKSIKNTKNDNRDNGDNDNKGNKDIINNTNNNSKKMLYKKPKISNEEFSILTHNNYEEIHRFNYTLVQLKTMCKYHNLKLSGNKDRLTTRLYIRLREIYHSIKIQALVRRYIICKYIKIHGEGFKNKDKCVNDKDFYTLDNLNEIPHYQFFSYKNDGGFIYGFDICSLYNYISKEGDKAKNPYNRENFPTDLRENVNSFIIFSKLLKYPIDLEIIDIITETTPDKKLNERIITLFSKIDELGFYTNVNWVINLDRRKHIRFLREIVDIWLYRAQLTSDTKHNIYPLNGCNPFYEFNTQHLTMEIYSNYSLKKFTVNVIDNLINNGIDASSKWLGASYCLAAITLVNNDAAQALPWLYQSVLQG